VNQLSPKNLLSAVVGAVILLEILSLSLTSSHYPWGVLSHPSLGLRIIGWVLICQSGFALMALGVMALIPDKPCPICCRDLKRFIPVYGIPVFCPRCMSMFHQNCFKSKPRCPVCFPQDEGESTNPLDFTRDWT